MTIVRDLRTEDRNPMRNVAILALLSVFAIGCGFNEVIEADEDVKAAWADVENHYQRRADLVPNLVATVKGVKNYERETLEAVVQARAKVGSIQVDSSIIDDPERLEAFERAQGQLGSALSRLIAVAEDYPELKATDAYRDLQSPLEGTENRIAVARRRYIEAVAEYNKVVLRFPSMIGASLRGKKERPTFKATTENAHVAPEVDL
jgi:LemA protein